MIAKALRARSIREKLYEKKMALTKGWECTARAGVNGPRGKSRLANRAAAIASRNFVRDACIFSLISLNSIWWQPRKQCFTCDEFVSQAGFANDRRSPLKRYRRFQCAAKRASRRPTSECILLRRCRRMSAVEKSMKYFGLFGDPLFILSVCCTVRYKLQYESKRELSTRRKTFWRNKKIIFSCTKRKEEKKRETLGN